MFFDTLELKWWYEPEGFDLYFDYDEFASAWDFTDEELLEEGIPQVFKALDGREYSYLPDFYLPELNYWTEIKGPLPNKEELLKAFFLSEFVYRAASAKLDEATTAKEQDKAFSDLLNGGVYVFYGNIPWPFPERGNAVGYGVEASGGVRFGPKRLYACLGLCWQQCRLCLKIGINSIGETYCTYCKLELEEAIYRRSGMEEEIGKELYEARRLMRMGLILDVMEEEIQDPLAPKGQETERSKMLREILTRNTENNRRIQKGLEEHDRLVRGSTEFRILYHRTQNARPSEGLRRCEIR